MFTGKAHAPAHLYTACWGCCNISTSQLQSLCEFLCDIYAEYGCYKKCEFRNMFPDAPVSHRYLHNLRMREKATGEMFHLSKRTRVKHVLRKNWSQLVLDWRHLQDNRWFGFHSNWACLCHKYGDYCISIHIRHLWFTNCAARIVKQEWISWGACWRNRRHTWSV